MPKYFYTAKSLTGKTKTGTKEAVDEYELAKTLRQQGLILISAVLEEKNLKRKKINLIEIFQRFQRVSLTERIMMIRNLQVMISAGVDLPRALKILSLQTKNKRLTRVLTEIRENVMKGKSFSDALGAWPSIFPEMFSSMIKIGEEAGQLEEVLKTLSNQLEREYELKSKIKGAMMYPLVVVLAMVGIGIAMLVMVVPKLAETFEELEIELPLTTRIVINTGNFLIQKWYLIFGIIVFLIFLFRVLLKTKKGKKALDGFLFKVPLIAPLIKKINSAYTIRTFANLIKSGVPLVRSLEIISNSLDNFYFKESLISAQEKVQKGGKLSEALLPYQDLYSSTAIQMLEVGEETGETSSILGKLADFFEEEVTNTTKNLTAVIEPILLLLVGGIIGFFAISMVQPMYSMLGGI
ncbi:MAG: hypothetical protein COS47_01435 [Candidatus Nealsonbacteria bacterium CG03_land_8_20_14_0_80_36_12]|uniref:Type II secretion system protein GspF domain-containing protein n=1 Tax=Candidatus Nealsonbacteria bacterium CG03_land_8_20_14_0_80_36_12 TaxID=1974701 RepID=A0A2M7BYA5_9BACT|nr:MAG: hypothetical protein COS47_01435 [Candidatus Nealsonbacteria bacterium CG03_land_8_20_14_0_80_36_12]